MNKFKVGDIVVGQKLPNSNGRLYLHPYLSADNKYHVLDTCKDMIWIVDDQGELEWWSEDWFKLAETNMEEENMERTVEQIREEILRINTRIEEANKDISIAEKQREELIDKLREKGFELVSNSTTDGGYRACTAEDVKVGDILITIDNSLNDCIDIGQEVRVEVNDKSTTPFYVVCLETGNADWIKADCVKFK